MSKNSNLFEKRVKRLEIVGKEAVAAS